MASFQRRGPEPFILGPFGGVSDSTCTQLFADIRDEPTRMNSATVRYLAAETDTSACIEGGSATIGFDKVTELEQKRATWIIDNTTNNRAEQYGFVTTTTLLANLPLVGFFDGQYGCDSSGKE